jgi:hypothetical protein
MRTAVSGPTGPYGARLAWRLYIDNNNGHASITGFSELKLYDQSGSQISTSGGTVLTGGSGSGASDNLFDGNTATSWNRTSATGSCFCGYKFSSPQAVASIDLYNGTDMTIAPKVAHLQYSDDTTNGIDGTWTTAFDIWEPSWPASGTATRTWPQDFTGGKHKAFRWNVTANNGDRFAVMNEAEMHSTHGGADQTPNGVSFTSLNSTQDGASALFDDNTATHLDADNNAGQIPFTAGYYFANTLVINEYNLTENNATTRGWKNWTFQYSDDGATWTTLDTQTNITWSTLPQTQTFSF